MPLHADVAPRGEFPELLQDAPGRLQGEAGPGFRRAGAVFPREGGRWELAPAYDLTDTHFAEGPWSAWTDTQAHAVNGKTSEIGDADLLAVAERFGIGTAPALLARVHATAKDVCNAR